MQSLGTKRELAGSEVAEKCHSEGAAVGIRSPTRRH